MSKREKFIAVIMASVLVIWGLQIIKGPKLKAINPAEIIAQEGVLSSPTEGESTVDVDRLIERMAVQTYEAEENKINPFLRHDQRKLLEMDEVGISDLHLQGIFLEQDEPVVLMNGEILREADWILGFQILLINENEVIMTKDMERYTLRLHEEDAN